MHDAFYAEILRERNESGIQGFEIDDNTLFVGTSDKWIEIVVPYCMKELILYMHHYSLLPDHLWGRNMYYKFWKYLYSQTLVVDWHATLQTCAICARNRLKLGTNVTWLRLFPAKEQLTSVLIGICGPFIHPSCKLSISSSLRTSFRRWTRR